MKDRWTVQQDIPIEWQFNLNGHNLSKWHFCVKFSYDDAHIQFNHIGIPILQIVSSNHRRNLWYAGRWSRIRSNSYVSLSTWSIGLINFPFEHKQMRKHKVWVHRHIPNNNNDDATLLLAKKNHPKLSSPTTSKQMDSKKANTLALNKITTKNDQQKLHFIRRQQRPVCALLAHVFVFVWSYFASNRLSARGGRERESDSTRVSSCRLDVETKENNRFFRLFTT